MGADVSKIFINNSDFESFKNSVFTLNGNFPFSVEDMISLGRAYFDRYPDSFSDRNSAEVLLGYKIIRVCIMEKALRSLRESYKIPLRSIFFSISEINSRVKELSEMTGPTELMNLYNALSDSIDEIRSEIDSIPIGMIKERFIGAITNFYNVLYLLKKAIEKSAE